MDDLVFEQSLASEFDTSKFLKKEVNYITDANSGLYSSQLILDCGSIATNGKFVNFSESWITIPLTMYCYGNDTAVAPLVVSKPLTFANSAFICALKCNSSMQLIHSMNIEFNGVSISQPCNYSNIICNFKVLSTWSKNDVTKFGSFLNIAPDLTTSMYFNNAASPYGMGMINNLDGYVTPSLNVGNGAGVGPSTATIQNTGLLQRQMWSAFTPAVGLTTVAQCATVNKSYFTTGAYGTGNVGLWYSIAFIRLKDLHCNVFDRIGLVRGLYVKLYLTLNQSQIALTNTSISGTFQINGNWATNGANITSYSNGTNLVMVTPAVPTVHGGGSIVDTQASANGINVTVGLGVAKTMNGTVSAIATPLQPNCRLYFVSYTLNPSYEQQLISMETTKQIEYSDYIFNQCLNIPASQTFTFNITSGASNMKSLLAVPFITTTAHADGTFNSILSPFSTSPWTTDYLLGGINNLQIQIANNNLYNTALIYNYDVFVNETSRLGLNGSATTGLCSGLLSSDDYDTGYKYLYFNLSRGFSENDVLPKSLTITAQNQNNIAIDLLFFIEVRKVFNLSIITGQFV